MKRIPFTPQLLFVTVVTVLVLAACERPVPREDTTTSPDAVPTTDTIIIPTAPPVTDNAGNTGDAGDASSDTATTEESASDGAAEPVTETPAETPPETEQPGEETPGAVTHVVKSGETLGQIAELYGVSVADIATANNIADIDSVDVGQELVIKGGAAAAGGEETTPGSGEQVHVVQTGDNLFRIGLRYGFTPEELASYNNIPDITRIEVGQIIKIPPK